jgi:hypothetical protein
MDREISQWETKLSGCETALNKKTPSYFYGGKKGDAMERYHNKVLGYSIEVPKTWGAIYPFAGDFTDDLYDGMETIGPNLGTGDNGKYYIWMESFSPDNTANNAFEDYDSLFDFYEAFRLKNKEYEIIPWEKSTKGYDIREFLITNEEGRTHRVILNKERAFVFVYNRNNSIHQHIIESFEIDK